MWLVAGGFGALLNLAPGSAQELPETQPSKMSTAAVGSATVSESVVIEPVAPDSTEAAATEPTTYTTLPQDTLKPAARDTAEKLMPLIVNQTETTDREVVIDEVIIKEDETPGVSLLITTATECTTEFILVNNSDSPETTNISLSMWGATDLVDKIIKSPPDDPEATDLLYSTEIGHGDNLFPDSILVTHGKSQGSKEARPSDKVHSLESAAAEIENITDQVCSLPELLP